MLQTRVRIDLICLASTSRAISTCTGILKWFQQSQTPFAIYVWVEGLLCRTLVKILCISQGSPWVQAKAWPNPKQQIEWKQVPEAFN